MVYSLSYFKDALQDVKEAKRWYKNQKPGIEIRFSEAIKVSIYKLQKNPFAYAIRYKNVRISHPKSFPYGIHFCIDDIKLQIVIIAIVHNKRHPNTAKDRV
jgi:plasmid stabilization system protein ParE